MEIGSRVTGKPATFVEKSVLEMHEETGMPLEGLETAAFFDLYDYYAGLSYVLELRDLREVVGVERTEESP